MDYSHHIESNKPDGFMQYKNCPVCKRPLVPIRKILDSGIIGQATAKVCANKSCFHFTNLSKLIGRTDDRNISQVYEAQEKRLPSPTRTLGA